MPFEPNADTGVGDRGSQPLDVRRHARAPGGVPRLHSVPAPEHSCAEILGQARGCDLTELIEAFLAVDLRGDVRGDRELLSRFSSASLITRTLFSWAERIVSRSCWAISSSGVLADMDVDGALRQIPG